MNPRLAGITPSLIRAINARKRPGDIDLGLGEPTLRPEMAPFEAALKVVRAEGLPYTPNAGVEALRAAVAAYCLPGGQPAQACITVGSEEALYLALKAALNPERDEVLVLEPGYLAYAKLCALEGIRCRGLGLDPATGFVPDAAAVLAALSADTRMLVLNTPCNPTGRIWPAGELKRLAAGLAERPEPVYVLCDEVYRELVYADAEHASLAAFHPHTLVAGSLSKSNALTGLRLGWLCGPAELIGRAIQVHQLVNTAASTFSSHVALEIFRRPGALAAHRPHYRAVRERLLAALRREGIEHAPVEGAFYCFIRLPPAWAGVSLQAAERLLEEKRVVSVPGVAFGAAGEGWLRLSWVAPVDQLEEGIRRIGEFFRG
jgi:aspartate/methionine/tyrosine aminotransferase